MRKPTTPKDKVNWYVHDLSTESKQLISERLVKYLPDNMNDMMLPNAHEARILSALGTAYKLEEYFGKLGINNQIMSLKTQFIVYNTMTKFIDFENEESIKSMNPGFGGSGGQELPYAFLGGHHAFLNSSCGGEDRPYSDSWSICSNEWFAVTFCTCAQYDLILVLNN